MPSPADGSDVLTSLTRKPERGADRALLDDLLDTERAGTFATIVDGQPWTVPMLFARDGDSVLLHGSTGAGLLRHVADGWPVSFSVFAMDGLVIAETLVDHSANYRSVVIRGTVTPVDDPLSALQTLSDKLIPGRVAETPQPTAKDLAATTVLRLPIEDGSWIAKARTGATGHASDGWTGVIGMRTVYDAPVAENPGEVPGSVQRLTGSGGDRRRLG